MHGNYSSVASICGVDGRYSAINGWREVDRNDRLDGPVAYTTADVFLPSGRCSMAPHPPGKQRELWAGVLRPDGSIYFDARVNRDTHSRRSNVKL